VSAGKSVPLRFTCSMSGSVLMQTTNSRVARTLRSVSFSPTDVKDRTGGSIPATVKKECGARLSTPVAEREDTHAMGRGTTTELSHG
jgi:hypothetical protein